MNTMYKRIKHAIGLAVMFIVVITSCTDENVGEFTLTGNIEQMIPEHSYSLITNTTSDGKYIIFTPFLDSNFEYWGLTLEKVEYYIDGTLYSVEQNSPCELILKEEDMTVGTHELCAKMTITGASCEDAVIEERVDFYISSSGSVTEQYGDFYIDYNYISKGDYLVITPELLTNRSTLGCEIDEVKYYWDGNLIATESESPFSLKYQVNDEAESSHNINIIVYYHDSNSDGLAYNWTLSGYKVCTDDEGFVMWNIKSSRNDYTNGESISLVAKQFKGKNVKNKFDIEFYLDGKLIGKSSSFPYTLDYELTGLSVGTHTITGKYYERKDDGYTASSYDKTIIITE